ncbi:MAG: hypothetical protein WCF59_01110 [Desulfobaccales bacterium]|jgi:hypothetical protein
MIIISNINPISASPPDEIYVGISFGVHKIDVDGDAFPLPHGGSAISFYNCLAATNKEPPDSLTSTILFVASRAF